jgi:Zn-dependent peptidase ImmA (M78 family)
MNHRESEDLLKQELSVPINAEQATSLIIERAKQLVNRVIASRGYDKPPFLAEEFGCLQGIKRIVKTDLGKASAILLRLQDGYVIRVNQNHHPVRQNFSCAHEIGHILFSELKLERYINNIEYRIFNPQGEQKDRAKARERLCDAAAAELLMPESVFGKYLSGFGVSVHSIERLANIFKVSIQTTAIRIAELSTEPCIALLWRQQRTKSKALELAWRVGPGGKSRGKADCKPVHTRIRYPSTLHKAYEYESSAKCYKLFKVDNAVKRLPMESKGFGRGETRRVISLAFPER